MKKIDELGISPTPWRTGDKGPIKEDNAVYCDYTREDGTRGSKLLADCNGWFIECVNDALLIAAAPELYECLREAVLLKCSGCASDAGEECLWQGECYAKKWRAALGKAGGGE